MVYIHPPVITLVLLPMLSLFYPKKNWMYDTFYKPDKKGELRTPLSTLHSER